MTQFGNPADAGETKKIKKGEHITVVSCHCQLLDSSVPSCNISFRGSTLQRDTMCFSTISVAILEKSRLRNLAQGKLYTILEDAARYALGVKDSVTPIHY